MVAFYLRDLTEQSHSVAPLEAAVYSIQWVHTIAGHQSPTQHPMVKSTLEGARGRLGKPVSPKEPLSLELIRTLAYHYNIRLEHIFLFSLLVRYAGFMRMEELLEVRFKDFTFNSSFMTILVGKRKNDQHRDGHKINIVESGKISCPVPITRKLNWFIGG